VPAEPADERTRRTHGPDGPSQYERRHHLPAALSVPPGLTPGTRTLRSPRNEVKRCSGNPCASLARRLPWRSDLRSKRGFSPVALPGPVLGPAGDDPCEVVVEHPTAIDLPVGEVGDGVVDRGDATLRSPRSSVNSSQASCASRASRTSLTTSYLGGRAPRGTVRRIAVPAVVTSSTYPDHRPRSDPTNRSRKAEFSPHTGPTPTCAPAPALEPALLPSDAIFMSFVPPSRGQVRWLLAGTRTDCRCSLSSRYRGGGWIT
jgi:hypothetical protein